MSAAASSLGFFAGDVGRQGNFAEGVEEFADVGSAGEGDAAMAFLVGGGDFGADLGRIADEVAEDDFGLKAGALAGAEHDPPIVDGVFFEQEDFKLAAGLGVAAAQARRDDAGIVEDEDVAGAEVIGEIAEILVRNFFGVAVDDEQAGLIALGDGSLGDQFGRQNKIKIGGAHF